MMQGGLRVLRPTTLWLEFRRWRVAVQCFTGQSGSLQHSDRAVEEILEQIIDAIVRSYHTL